MVNLRTFIPPSAQVNPLVDVGECHWPFPRHTKWESALVYIRPPRQSLSKLQCPPDVHSLLARLVLVSPMRKVFWRMQRPSHIYMTAWLYSEKGNRPTGFGFSSSDTVVWKKNRSFRPLQGITPICSDMFVMRIAAANTSSVVNMRDRDTILADYMIPRWRVSVLNVGDIFWLNLCRHRFAHTISRFKSGRRLLTLLKFRRSLGIRRR